MGLRGWPHWGQYLAVDVTWLPQLSQARASGAAHSSQNFALALFSCWHFGHFIAGPEGRSEPVGPARVTSRMVDASRFSCGGQDRHRRLLRPRRKRPRRRCADRAAEQRDELAALHVDFVLPFASPATACHPASLIFIRVTSIILPSATMRSACADASPARTSSSSSSAVNPFANISASLQPSGEAARSSRAGRRSGLGPRRWRWGWGMELAVVVARDLAAL